MFQVPMISLAVKPLFPSLYYCANPFTHLPGLILSPKYQVYVYINANGAEGVGKLGFFLTVPVSLFSLSTWANILLPRINVQDGANVIENMMT